MGFQVWYEGTYCGWFLSADTAEDYCWETCNRDPRLGASQFQIVPGGPIED